MKKKLAFRFIMLESLYYAVYTSYSAFILAYLQAERGLSDSTASGILALYTIGSFSGQFVFGRLCDRFRTHRKVLYLICGAMLVIGVAMYSCKNVVAICLLYLLFGFCESPLPVVIDTWFMDTFVGDTGLYGKMLAGGAVTYAVLGFSYGKLLDNAGYAIMPWCFGALTVLALLLASSIPDASCATGEGGAKANIRGLFSGPLMLFMAALLFTGMCGNTYNLLPILMENVNGSLGLLGFAMSSSGIAQIPFMMLSGRIARIPSRIRMAISGGIYFVMIMCFALGTSPWHLIFGACISGAAWGIMLPAYREIISELSHVDLRTTAQSMGDAVYDAVGGVASSGIVSVASATFGIQTSLLGLSAVQLAAIGISLAVHYKTRIKKRRKLL